MNPSSVTNPAVSPTSASSPLPSESDALTLGRRVLEQESAALSRLAQELGPAFTQAIDLLRHLPGRLVVTGMGKSGHIARKIAATFSSTGTPAYFIHPGEASHGDLGAVALGDGILALSNSGETEELADILTFAARRSLPIIAITRSSQSFLGKQADCCLTLPDVGEACPLGCAPTSSTTMMLALGDALALTLLQLKGFTAEDFSHFHPGGHLGRKLKLVRDIMHSGTEMPLADQNIPMSEALILMSAKGFGCIGLTQAATLVGIISDGDLRRHMGDTLLHQVARNIMTKNPATIPPDAPAAKAVALMNTKKITSLFVAHPSTSAPIPLGIIHLHDCLRAGLA